MVADAVAELDRPGFFVFNTPCPGLDLLLEEVCDRCTRGEGISRDKGATLGLPRVTMDVVMGGFSGSIVVSIELATLGFDDAMSRDALPWRRAHGSIVYSVPVIKAMFDGAWYVTLLDHTP